MFKLCHKVPDNDIQGFVPHYIIEDDEDNEGFGKKAALKVILRNYYKDYEDAKLQSLEKEGSEQSMVCKKQTLQI